MTKRKVLPIEQLSNESQKLYDILNNEKDFTVVLVATSFLDACLGSILNNKLIDSCVSKELLGTRGILGNFSSRTDLCYALGLIHKLLYKDLRKIAEIRNEFAHYHLELTFESEEIEKKCNELLYVASYKLDSTKESAFAHILHDSRSKFILTTVMITQRLLMKGLSFNRVHKST